MKNNGSRKGGQDDILDVERQSVASRLWHSIRTRCSLMTAIFLLLAIALFYVGSRIVFIHFVREAESQMKNIGADISRAVEHQSAKVRDIARRVVADLPAPLPDARYILTRTGYPFSVVAHLTAEGVPVDVCRREADGSLVQDAGVQLEDYRETLAQWVRSPQEREMGRGIVRINGRLSYVAIIRQGKGWILFGLSFESDVFGDRSAGGIAGVEIRVSVQQLSPALIPTAAGGGRARARPRMEFGLAPMLSEAIDFYSGGFWKFGEKPFSAVYALRDIAGHTVSTVSVSIPRTFVSVTRVAVWRLGFIVALIGLFLVVPLFWLQGKLLLNPLTKMTKAIAEIGRHNSDIDCPRLDWHGKDEFALLALSVNRMLETISARAVAVAQSEEQHQVLIAGIPDALAIFDTKGCLITFTKEAEGGVSFPGFRPGEPPQPEVFGREAVEEFQRVLGERFAQGGVGKLCLNVRAEGDVPRVGTVQHLELRLTRMDAFFVLAVVRDVTKEVEEHRQLMEAQARANESTKRESLTLLAAGIAHDMNNVLSIVLNAAEADGADPSGDSSETLGTIREAIRRGSTMMKELMTFAGENRISLLRVTPKLLLGDVLFFSKKTLPANVLLTCEATPGITDVDADPNQIWKVFFNIIKNAGEAIGLRPGHIVVKAEAMEMNDREAARFLSARPLPAGRGVLFTIQDDGPGIPLGMLSRLFDPYVSSKAVGRGLGLATVRTIVEAHEGGIAVSSVVDRGTTFRIYLPESKLPAESAPAAGAEDGELSGKVLVVDDETSILKMTSILLKSLKMTPFVARDAAEALAVVRRHADTLRVILLDANLGGVDTVRLVGAFRNSAPRVPVVVSTGSAEDAIRKLFVTNPYDGFLAKPYTIAELKTALQIKRGNGLLGCAARFSPRTD